MTDIGARHMINDREYEVTKITPDLLSFGAPEKAWVQLKALDGSGTITFQREDLEPTGATENGAFQLPGQGYPQPVDNFSDKIDSQTSEDSGQDSDTPQTPERLIWTVAHRNPRANRFLRSGSDRAFTWAVASALGNHLAAADPSHQFWVTTSLAHDTADPSEDSHNILVDSGKRVTVKTDPSTATDDLISAAFDALVAIGHALLDTPAEPPQTAQTSDVSVADATPMPSLHGVEAKITATYDDGTPDGKTFDVAVVPNGDPSQVMYYARVAFANPLWFNVTIEEIMPSATVCDHPACDRAALFTGLRHEANAVRAADTAPRVAGEILVPPHVRYVNVCGSHAVTWGLWGYTDKPSAAPSAPVVDTAPPILADWTSVDPDPVFKFRVGYRVEFGGTPGHPDSPSFATVANVGSRWLYLVDYDGNKLGKVLRTDARALNYR